MKGLNVRIWRLYKVDPRTKEITIFPMVVDPWLRYSNESERANWDIYYDFKLKNPLVSMVYTNTFQPCQGKTAILGNDSDALCSPTLFTLWSAEIILYKPRSPKGHFQFEIITNVLVSSYRFIYIPRLCYQSTTIRNVLILLARGPSLWVK